MADDPYRPMVEQKPTVRHCRVCWCTDTDCRECVARTRAPCSWIAGDLCSACWQLPALTIWQPWASLIVAGAKPLEWRGWKAPAFAVGQRIAIHAGARPVRKIELRDLLMTLRFEGRKGTSLDPDIAIPLLERWHTQPGELPLSSVVCTALLGRSIPALAHAAQQGIDSDRVDHAKWGWPLSRVIPVAPIAPATGKQGFWWWKPDVTQ